MVSATAPLFFVHVDHLNTPRFVANQSGQTVWRWDQAEPFGVDVPDENPSGLGAFEFPLRFPGQYADKETNAHYNYFRNYDPGIGRYAESDPIGLKGGLNTYAYVDSKPLRRTDPRGLNPDDAPPLTTCRPPHYIKVCLDKIMGEDVGDVVVTSDPKMAFPYAITSVNSITTRDSCPGFFSHPGIVLHEYYHVLRQWNAGRLSTFRYLWDNIIDGGYEKNRWEVEARNFAASKLEDFQRCINCCK
jgi:RHS repeat-associated protein